MMPDMCRWCDSGMICVEKSNMCTVADDCAVKPMAMCQMDFICTWDTATSTCANPFIGGTVDCDVNSDVFKNSIKSMAMEQNQWHVMDQVMNNYAQVDDHYKEQVCTQRPPFAGACTWISKGEHKGCKLYADANALVPWVDYATQYIECNFDPSCQPWRNGPQKTCSDDWGWQVCEGCVGTVCTGFHQKIQEAAAGQDLNQMPFKGEPGMLTLNNICIKGVKYKDHFCNSSIMGLIAVIATGVAGMLLFCALRLFALPLFFRVMRCCCGCCFDDDK